jgi:hypothetical protein
MHEMHLRDRAATRAVMNIKLRLHDAGVFVPLSSKEHFLREADFREWAKTETDPAEKAELTSLGNLCETLGWVAHSKNVAADETRKARNAKRAARRKARKLAAKSPPKPGPRS